MDRRSFLLNAAGGSVLAMATAAGFWRWQETTAHVHFPGREEGHYLRDIVKRKALPEPSAEFHTDVVIAGSGIAGLTAAWKLNKEGHQDLLVINGPEHYGNAAGGQWVAIAYPTGSHYLPLPSTESFHVREILNDLGIILRHADQEKPYYDERCILHAPEARLLHNGCWQEGLIPRAGLDQHELNEHERFFNEMARLQTLRGNDGRRLFVFPSVLSSHDEAWRALDTITFKHWLETQGYHSPSLHWYVNYCCRDDYGASYDQVSAWAGLHYFCSRGGKAENAEDGTWLTWPGGLQPLAAGLEKSVRQRCKTGSVISLKSTPEGVEALCFVLEKGQPVTYRVHARKAVCAMPLYVAARVVESISRYGFNAAEHGLQYAPWLVSNFLMKHFPAELPDTPLAWDNMVYHQKTGLGYVVATHQDIRVQPSTHSVFTSYVALSNRTPKAARAWLNAADPDALLDVASADLKAAYGWKLAACVESVEMTVRGHAMAIPYPGFRANAGLHALREAAGPIVFAHSDLSGFSVFEEAAWWGYQAALKVMKG